MAERVDREIGRLYGLSLEEFTPARNELARRLKQQGNDAAAEEVRALAKPSVPVWAINQLARREPDAVRALLSAGAALRKAQERALRGSRAADAVREAQEKERKAVHDLRERARSLLQESNRPATQPTIERISRTLESAAVDEQGRAMLKAGRLSEELEPSGFEALAGVELASPAVRSSGRDELAERRTQKAERERRKRALEQKLRDLEQRAREAEQDADRAETAAVDARRKAEEARAAADEAAAELADL